MGKVFENLTWDDLCDLMCGSPEEDGDDDGERGCDSSYEGNKRGMLEA